MDFLTDLDSTLSGISHIFHAHGELLMGVGIGLFMLIAVVSGIVSEAAKDSKKSQAEAARQKAINEGLAKGVLPEDIHERLDGRRSKAKKPLPPIDQTHLDLLSGFTECAYLIKDTGVSDTVFELGAVVDQICKRLKGEKKLVGSMKDFLEYHAPETLKVAREYQRLAANAMTDVLHAELANTAAVLSGTKGDFMAYLASYEEGEATKLAILSITRQRIGKIERPYVAGGTRHTEALPPPEAYTLESGRIPERVHVKS